jgi:F-type H+-transporting ATPase subunit b
LKRLSWSSLLLGFLLWAAQTCAIAAAESHGHSSEGGSSTLLWKSANFIILAGFLGYFIYKKAGAFFRARTEAIRKEMEEAGQMRREAEARAAELEKRMANLQAEIESLRAGARAEMAAEGQRLQQETQAVIEKMQKQAEQEIAGAAKAAAGEVRAHAAELAIELAAEKIKARMTPVADASLTGAFLDGIEKIGSKPHKEVN